MGRGRCRGRACVMLWLTWRACLSPGMRGCVMGIYKLHASRVPHALRWSTNLQTITPSIRRSVVIQVLVQ